MGELSFWQQCWISMRRVLAFIGTKLVAPGVALLLIAGAVLLVVLGVKNLQIGGILSKLFGHKPEKSMAGTANTVPHDRVDAQGKLIPVGQPDAKGVTQATVVPIQPPGLFSNPDTVKFVPPGQGKPVEVQLPVGVKANDVQNVIVVKPDVYVVTVTDESKIPAQKIDDLISKYGG